MHIIIEKSIPIPAASTRGGARARAIRDAYTAMNDGDSFTVNSFIESKSARAIARQMNLAVSVRKVDGEKYRVWLKQRGHA